MATRTATQAVADIAVAQNWKTSRRAVGDNETARDGNKSNSVTVFPDVQSISLQRLSITVLGDAFIRLPNLITLDLSRNSITSLQGIQVLQNLTKLNLYYNRISSGAELKHLASLPLLTVVDLRLNPVARAADYRMFALQNISGLNELDERPVRRFEKRRAQEIEEISDADITHAVSAAGMSDLDSSSDSHGEPYSPVTQKHAGNGRAGERMTAGELAAHVDKADLEQQKHRKDEHVFLRPGSAEQQTQESLKQVIGTLTTTVAQLQMSQSSSGSRQLNTPTQPQHDQNQHHEHGEGVGDIASQLEMVGKLVASLGSNSSAGVSASARNSEQHYDRENSQVLEDQVNPNKNSYNDTASSMPDVRDDLQDRIRREVLQSREKVSRVERENKRLAEENKTLIEEANQVSQALRDVRQDCAGLRMDNSELRRSLEAEFRRNKEFSELVRIGEREKQTERMRNQAGANGGVDERVVGMLREAHQALIVANKNVLQEYEDLKVRYNADERQWKESFRSLSDMFETSRGGSR